MRRGWSLVEAAIVLGTLAALAAAVASAAAGRRDQAMAWRAVREAQEIAEAAERYYWRTGAWPASLAALVPDDLPPRVLEGNPWGGPWSLAASGRRVSVSTVIPVGRVPADAGASVDVLPDEAGTRLTVSRVVDDGGGAYALYEKRHLYRQP